MNHRLLAGVAIGAAASAVLSAAPAYAGPLQDAVGAPEDFKLRAAVRSRTEAIDGQFRPGRPESDFLQSFRTQIFGKYDAGPVRLGAELIDVRGYGQKANSSAGTSEINALELSQAYLGLDVEDSLGSGSTTTVTAGRYILSLGSKRLVSGTGWRNTVNAFTGTYLDWKRGDDRFVALWAMPHMRLPNDAESIRDNEVEWDEETPDLQFFGASFTRGAVLGEGTLELYGYGLAERDSAERQTANRRLFTPGLRLAREPAAGTWDFDVEAAYQFGHIRGSKSAADVNDLDVSAWYTHAELGRTFDAAGSPRLAVHFDKATGDGPDADSYNRFDTLYGNRRTDYGPTGLYGAVQRANMVSLGVRAEVEPSDRFDVAVMGRRLWLDEATDSFASTGVRDRTGASGRDAGTQIEARVRYWVVPKVIRIDAGVAHLEKGRFLTDAPNAPATGDTNYGYLDVIFDF